MFSITGDIVATRVELGDIFPRVQVGDFVHVFLRSVLHTADGDLFFNEAGTVDLSQTPPMPPFLRVGGSVTGGTGAWENASGGLAVVGPVNAAGYSGVICTADDDDDDDD